MPTRSGCTLYIRRVQDDTRLSDLKKLFHGHARFRYVEIRGFKRHCSYAYVELNHHGDVGAAIEYLNGLIVKGIRIRVELGRKPLHDKVLFDRCTDNVSRSTNRVLVTGFPADTRWMQLRVHMEEKGKVLFCQILCDNCGEFAIVDYDQTDRMELAVKELSGSFFRDSLLKENLQQWSADGNAREQFLVPGTEVVWNDASQLIPTENLQQWSADGNAREQFFVPGTAVVWNNAAQLIPTENLQHWLTDGEARKQSVICAGSDAEILWNDARQLMLDLVYDHTLWTERFFPWSPLGTYLTTVHRLGAALCGGAETFSHLMSYVHPQVKLTDFSPGKRFLVTYGCHEPSNPCDTYRVALNVFDVRTGKLTRDFEGSVDEFLIGRTGGAPGVDWPFFRWDSGKDDKYFARIAKSVPFNY